MKMAFANGPYHILMFSVVAEKEEVRVKDKGKEDNIDTDERMLRIIIMM